MGNLESRRDWGFAGDYVRAMHLMMQQPEPDDYVIGTGETYQIKECARIAFERVGLNYEDYVRTDEQFMRPAEVDLLIADASKAKEKLGWTPKTTLNELVKEMVQADFTAAKRDALIKLAGFQAYDYHE